MPADRFEDLRDRLQERHLLKHILPSVEECRAARIDAGATQGEVAALVGVTASAVAGWERGRCRPSDAYLRKYAAVIRSLRDLADQLEGGSDDNR